jgi:hypothetical protein
VASSPIDLTPHVVVTVHTPGGDVPIVADLSNPSGGGGSVNILGVAMPYDIAMTFGLPPDTSGPGTLFGNVQAVSPYLLLGAVVLGALFLARRGF